MDATSRRRMTLPLALLAVPITGAAILAGPAAGVAHAVTPKFPDRDEVFAKTSGGEMTGSWVNWTNANGYTRHYEIGDTLNEKRCVAVFEAVTDVNGKVGPAQKIKQACDNQVGIVEGGNTSPTKIRSLEISLCRLTAAGMTETCFNKFVKPGID